MSFRGLQGYCTARISPETSTVIADGRIPAACECSKLFFTSLYFDVDGARVHPCDDTHCLGAHALQAVMQQNIPLLFLASKLNRPPEVVIF
jgi:hypothetical protein